MATMTGSVSSSGSGWKTGWDFFWREQREEVQKNLPKGLSFEEAKKEFGAKNYEQNLDKQAEIMRMKISNFSSYFKSSSFFSLSKVNSY